MKNYSNSFIGCNLRIDPIACFSYLNKLGLRWRGAAGPGPVRLDAAHVAGLEFVEAAPVLEVGRGRGVGHLAVGVAVVAAVVAHLLNLSTDLDLQIHFYIPLFSISICIYRVATHFPKKFRTNSVQDFFNPYSSVHKIPYQIRTFRT